MQKIIGLIKIGEKEHMRQLYEEGIIFMRHLSTFPDIKDDFRGDIYEKLSLISDVFDFKMYGTNEEGKEVELYYAENGRVSLSYYYPEELAGNIYSMVGLFTDERSEEIKVDEQCLQFGDNCVIITDPGEFVSRVKKAALIQNIDLTYDLTEYYDIKEYTGAWSPFKKPSHLSYQKEFRFLVKRKYIDPVILKIGPINDISIMTNSLDLNRMTFTPENR